MSPIDTAPTTRRRTNPREAQHERHTGLVLLDWLAGELRATDGLGRRDALRFARQLLNEAFASVDQNPNPNSRKETTS